METITQVVSQASDFLWNVILIILLCGTGVFFTFRLKFIQVRRFKEGLKIVFGNMKLKGDKSINGEMTPFQSVATAIAAQVGTGNPIRAVAGSHILDVGQRLFRYGYDLRRSGAGAAI